MAEPQPLSWAKYAKIAATCLVVIILALSYSAIFVAYLLYQLLKRPTLTIFSVKPRPLPPDCLQDPQLGHHGYLRIKNVKLHYVENGDKEKPLMLFLHGFPEFWYSWRHQIKEFSKDYWTVAIDMRGYGDSEKPQGIKYYRTKYLIEDVKNVIEALDKKKCILVAHDWGGAVAWNFLNTYPEYIDSYIIMNCPHPKAYRKQLTSNLSQFRKSWYFFFFQMPFLPELFMKMDDMVVMKSFFRSRKAPNPITENDLEAYKFMFGKPGGFTCPINYYRANLVPLKPAPKTKPKENGDMPKGLLIFGDQDIAIETSAAEETAEMVHNLTLQIIPGASHFVQQDDPEHVNKAMQEFLKKTETIYIEHNQ